MKPLFIPGAGMFISAEVCADLRHGAVRDLRAAQRDQAYVTPDTVAAVELMDTIGAAWANGHVPNVPEIDRRRSDAFESISVQEAARTLGVTTRAVTARLQRQTLHGQRGPWAWRVCRESVACQMKGTRCTH